MSELAGQRLWRLRKLHQWVDAEIRENAALAGSPGVEILLYYNGDVAYRRLVETRALAMAEATAKRAELEREGWLFHW